jgi:hypothetical protein
MTANTAAIAAAEALALHSLIVPSPNGIARRLLAKTTGGSVTLFALDRGQTLAEHTTPFDALVLVLEASLRLRVGGTPVHATSGTDCAHARGCLMRSKLTGRPACCSAILWTS